MLQALIYPRAILGHGNDSKTSCARGLEVELQGQLQFARIINRRVDYPEIAISHRHVRSLKLRMIKDIEGFGAKLETYTLIALGQVEIFEQRYVHVCSAGLAHAGDGAWSIAEGKWGDGSSVLQDSDIVTSGGVEVGIGKITGSRIGEFPRRTRCALQRAGQYGTLVERWYGIGIQQ